MATAVPTSSPLSRSKPFSFPLSPVAKDLTAGTCSGVISLLVVHPLDTIRVRLQTTSAQRFNGITDVVRSTLSNEGALALYKGMSVPLLSQGIQKATMFVSYGSMKRTLTEVWPTPFNPALPPVGLLSLCGAFAGLCNSLVAAPIELIRNRMQTQYARDKAQRQYKSPIDVIRQTLQHRGVTGLWTGTMPMIYRDVPGVAAWYLTNELVKRKLTETERANRQSIPAWKLMLSGACAGIGFWTFAFPQDTIKSIVQTRQIAPLIGGDASATALVHTSNSFWSVASELIRTDGIGRLWRGYTVALMRGIPGAAVTFTSYQLILNQLNELDNTAA